EREAKKRQREIERRAKEQAKLSELENARLEVEKYEGRLEVLLSVHKEVGENWNWNLIASILSPLPPKKRPLHELRAKHNMAISFDKDARKNVEVQVKHAQLLDESEFQKKLSAYTDEWDKWNRLNILARRILDGDHNAFADAIDLIRPLAEISNLGSSLQFNSHSIKLL